MGQSVRVEQGGRLRDIRGAFEVPQVVGKPLLRVQRAEGALTATPTGGSRARETVIRWFYRAEECIIKQTLPEITSAQNVGAITASATGKTGADREDQI